MPETDKTLPENLKENLDRKLDHAVEETFPTSDPTSVTITKGEATDYDGKGQPISSPSEQRNQSTTTEGLLGQAKESAANLAGIATEAAPGAFEQGRRYARQAAFRYPEAERSHREGTEGGWRQAAKNPLLIMLAGVAVGYALSWMIHNGSDEH